MGQLCDIVSHLILILRSNMREQNLFSYLSEIQINFILFISYLINNRRYEWKHIGFKSSAGEQKTSSQYPLGVFLIYRSLKKKTLPFQCIDLL